MKFSNKRPKFGTGQNKRYFSQIPGAKNEVEVRGGGHGSSQDVAERSSRQRQSVTI
jgi:hypothetical protein